jgi:hypothetical protein
VSAHGARMLLHVSRQGKQVHVPVGRRQPLDLMPHAAQGAQQMRRRHPMHSSTLHSLVRSVSCATVRMDLQERCRWVQPTVGHRREAPLPPLSCVHAEQQGGDGGSPLLVGTPTTARLRDAMLARTHLLTRVYESKRNAKLAG